MASRPLNVPFEVLGEWFLPHAPDRKIAGYLKYDPGEGSTVQLQQSFEFWFDAYTQEAPKRYHVVLGTTSDGEQVTMVDAMTTRWSADATNEHRADELFSSRVILGAHQSNSVRYCACRCRVPGLQLWLSNGVVERSHSRDKRNLLTLSYHVHQLETEVFYVPQLSGDLEWETPFEISDDDARTRVTINSSGWIGLRPDEPQSFDWFLEKIVCVTEFLSLIAGSAMAPGIFETYHEGETDPTVQLVALNQPRCCSFTDRLEFFLLRDSMGLSLAGATTNWFAIYPKVEVPVKVAVNALLASARWSHDEFMSLMQALEGYHRALFKGSYMDEAEYNKVRAALASAIPPSVDSDHSAALQSRIRYGNEFSLRKRLEKLSNLLSDGMRRRVLGCDGEVPQKWIDTRNYYTHWDESLRTKVLSGAQMHYVNARLRCWTRLLYLLQIGVPESAFATGLRRPNAIARDLAHANASQ